MKRKKILFVVQHLTVGGVQKSLISALNAIDYEKNDVTVYLRKKRLELLPYVNKCANVIANDDSRHYYRLPYSILLQGVSALFRVLHLTEHENKTQKRLDAYIRKKMMENERERYFMDEKFDVAISYVQGHNAAFVDEYINADKKIMFYQGSTDECHDVHVKTLPHFDRIMVEHEDVKNEMVKWYPEVKDKISILANYVDYDFIHAQSKEKTIPKTEKTVICSCGRFAPVKGMDLAANAAKILAKKYDFTWYFVGDGPEFKKVKSIVDENGLNDKVVFEGMQNNPYPYIAACDIYVHPSYEEAISMTIMEAQVLNAPVVSTKTLGGISMVNDGVDGILTDINAEALAEGIEKLITDKKLREAIRSKLESADYSAEQVRYRKDWAKLLED